MSDIFCKIISGELPGEFVYRDDEFVVIRDIHPKAPVHLLVMPITHVDDIATADAELLGAMAKLADKVAGLQGLNNGYRLVINEGEGGGKEVQHLHMHVLGGKEAMKW